MPTKSRFTFAIWPVNALSATTSGGGVVPAGTQLRSATPGAVSKSQVAVTQLIAALANQPYPDRVIRYTLVLSGCRRHICNNNNNNNRYIAPYVCNFKVAGDRSDRCSVKA